MNHIKKLAKALDIKLNEARELIENDSYMILADKEADDQATQYIMESVWAFNPSFLAAHCDLDSDVIKSIQANDRCEDNNEVLTRLIKDVDHFVEDAIRSDGRGHFISSYDGVEIELGNGFFAYRIN